MILKIIFFILVIFIIFVLMFYIPYKFNETSSENAGTNGTDLDFNEDELLLYGWMRDEGLI